MWLSSFQSNTRHWKFIEPGIPRLLFQTTNSKVPEKVLQNIKKYASDYKHRIFSDDDCVQFLDESFPDLVSTWKTLPDGAHKADLFRYAILLKHGGVYIDIKMQLLVPLSSIVNHNRREIVTIQSWQPDAIFQAFVAAPAGASIFRDLLQNIVTSVPRLKRCVSRHKNWNNYLIVIRFMHYWISQDTEQSFTGAGMYTSKTMGLSYKILQEIKRPISACPDGADRYGECTFTADGERHVIKNRYADYPW